MVEIWTGMMYRRPELFECEKGTKRRYRDFAILGDCGVTQSRAVAYHQDDSAAVELLSIE